MRHRITSTGFMDVSLADVVIGHDILKHIGSEARPNRDYENGRFAPARIRQGALYETAVVERWFMW
jgi:hypothetical protein